MTLLPAVIEFDATRDSFGQDDRGFDRVLCHACGKQLAMIWGILGHDADAVGFSPVLAPGIVNAPAAYANGLPWYRPASKRRTLESITLRHIHFVVTCWCGRDNEIGPPFFGFSVYFADYAQRKRRAGR